MPIIKGTTQIKIRNIDNIDINGQYIADGEPISNTMYGENLEQGVTVTMSSGTSTSVANGAKVSTSEKVVISWVLLGGTIDQMNSAASFSGQNAALARIKVNEVVITLIGGKTIKITDPVITCQRMTKVGDLFRYSFSIEKNGDNADDFLTYT